MMRYAVTTNTGIEVAAQWTGCTFQIVATPSGSVIIEWAKTLDRAVELFNKFIDKYTDKEQVNMNTLTKLPHTTITAIYLMETGVCKPGQSIGMQWMLFDTEETAIKYLKKIGNLEYIGKGHNDLDTYRITDSILLADIVYGIKPETMVTKESL